MEKNYDVKLLIENYKYININGKIIGLNEEHLSKKFSENKIEISQKEINRFELTLQ